MKTYGIVVAFPPGSNLHTHGLGRFLQHFCQASSNISSDIRFALFCPSWSKREIRQLLCTLDNPPEIVCPKAVPYLVRLDQGLKWWSTRTHRNAYLRQFLVSHLEAATQYFLMTFFRRLAKVNSGYSLLLFLPWLGVMIAVLPVAILFLGLRSLYTLICCQISKARPSGKRLLKYFIGQAKLGAGLGNSHRLLVSVYGSIVEQECARIVKIANRRPDIDAWYCPTAFWPEFRSLKAPLTCCIPDFFFREFPVGFSESGGLASVETFDNVEKVISSSHQLITYSETVKQAICVRLYGREPSDVHVIPNAPMCLRTHLPPLQIDGIKNKVAVTFAQWQLKLALAECAHPLNSGFIGGSDPKGLRFLFYASHFRPNKNVLNLIRAFKKLREQKLIHLKLLMTGNPTTDRGVREFVERHELERDVIFLNNLSDRQLASCYYLADLAINPSLSEGGLPFTFTESLSLETPVLLANTAVTNEFLKDDQLKNLSLFDPTDSSKIAEKISFALANREHLLAVQTEAYQPLLARTWENVVEEHVSLLDHISQRYSGEQKSNSG
ncbi:glycosyltransferase [Luminiphilus sp.]|nr:glycosyltransferase [Luminiphilus sp.]